MRARDYRECVPELSRLHGEAWHSAVRQAADSLLRVYKTKWKGGWETDLDLLAATLDTTVTEVRDLPREASILPTADGFTVLVRAGAGESRRRTSIAHELVHTLFYEPGPSIWRRASPVTDVEEQFCFDVSRRLLAPDWVIRALAGDVGRGATQLFGAVVDRLKVSCPVAARLLLQDNSLMSGVAGTWKKGSAGWVLRKGEGYASPDLKISDRRRLRSVERTWLETQAAPAPGLALLNSWGSTDATFVMVVRDEPGGTVTKL